MTLRELDTVVLTRDVPEAGLRAGALGALGAVIEVCGPTCSRWSSRRTRGGRRHSSRWTPLWCGPYATMIR